MLQPWIDLAGRKAAGKDIRKKWAAGSQALKPMLKFDKKYF